MWVLCRVIWDHAGIVWGFVQNKKGSRKFHPITDKFDKNMEHELETGLM